MMRLTMLALAAVLSSSYTCAQETALSQLLKAAGADTTPVVAQAPEGAPQAQEPGRMWNCTSDVKFAIRADGLFLRWAKYDAEMTVKCDTGRSAVYTITGEGPSFGLRAIDLSDPFHFKETGEAKGLHLRLPFEFMPEKLEGNYLRGGASALGFGLEGSAFTNSNANVEFSLILPTGRKTLFGIDVRVVDVKLKK